MRPDGRRVQHQVPPVPAALRTACRRTGGARVRTDHPPLALACARVGPARSPAALLVVGAPLRAARQALSGSPRRSSSASPWGPSWRRRSPAPSPSGRCARPGTSRGPRRRSARATSRGASTTAGRATSSAPWADVLDASFDELEQAVERQRRFVADASHELRTPLATIRAHVELLQGVGGPGARGPCERADRDRPGRPRGGAVLGSDLLFLAQLDRIPPAPHAATQLDQVVVDAVREAQALRPEVPIRVTRLDEARLAADELGLRRVLGNLLANALRVSPAAEEVNVTLEVGRGATAATVSDRGPGIPEDDLERIFERLHTTAPRRSGGSGLGLAIAREIARRHGGDLRAANRPGGGAELRLELPLDLTERAPASP